MATKDDIDEGKTTSSVVNNEVKIVAPRENMVSTAVHFLANPKVMKEGSVHQKKAFLQSKGLTDEEIALAFERADVAIPPTRSSAYLPVSERPPPLPPAPSLWMRMNHIGSSVIVLAIACYGIHRIYKLYIEPWLFGDQHKEDRLTEMEHQLVELNRSLSHLRRSVSTIEDVLASQKAQLSKLCDEAIPSTEIMQNPLIFSDIKSEVASIKSLLLGRQRFPPAPNVSRMIPSWQLEASSEKKDEDGNSSEKKNELKEEEGNLTVSHECSGDSDDLKTVIPSCPQSNQTPELQESMKTKPVSNGHEDSLLADGHSKSQPDEVINSTVNGELEDSASNAAAGAS